MSPEDNERYWDDLVHLTPDGYDLMGEKIAAALVEILKSTPDALPEPAIAPPSQPVVRRKKMFKDDENAFVEEQEEGDPPPIDKGYIVVRKKDLD